MKHLRYGFYSLQVKWYIIFSTENIIYIQRTSWVAEQLKTLALKNLGNIGKISKMGGSKA